MTDKIMMDGEPLEVGDPVWCLQNGWMILDSISKKTTIIPTVLYFKNEGGVQCSYTYFHDFAEDGTNRTLYWNEIKIIPPPKPKKKLKVWDWFVKWAGGGVSIEKGLTENQFNDSVVAIKQKIEGTEREIEQ